MAKFKNKDVLIETNEEILLGSSGEVSFKYDGSDLVINKIPKHSSQGYLATQSFVNSAILNLEWQDSVLSKTTSSPPGSPSYKDRYIVPSGASGGWSGHDDEIAEFNTTWFYTTPSAGFTCWVEDEGVYYTYNTSWVRMGTVVDHGNLDGLSDDDHTQYLNITRHDTFTRHTSASVDHGSIGGLGDDDHTQYLNIARHDTTTRHGSSVVDHGSIGGLGDDDHTQYLLADGTRNADHLVITNNLSISGDIKLVGDIEPIDNILTVVGDIVPPASTGYDLGTTSLPFHNIHCQTIYTSGGTVYIGSSSITESGNELFLNASKVNLGNTQTFQSTSGGIIIGDANLTTSRQLHISESTSGASSLIIQNARTNYNNNDGFYIGVGADTDEKAYIWNYENSDIYIGTNNNTVIQINSDGEINKPLQPTFSSYMTTNQNVSAGTAVTVQFDAERFDIGGNFNTTSYIFTAPVDGKYSLNATIRLNSLDSAATQYQLRLITSNQTYYNVIDPNFATDLNYYTMTLSVVADMDANDTAYIEIYQEGGTEQTTIESGDYTFFTGWLLG